LARAEAQNSRVSLQTQLSKEVPLILGDRIQLQQVILNLIINAIEAMSGVSEGPRELVIGSGKDDSQGVLVTVRDSGPGLDPDSLDHLFTAFYTTKPQGMGMGLAISRSIIRPTGGGCGPLRTSTEVQRFSLRCRLMPRGCHDRSRCHCFVVDDDEGMRQSLKKLIGSVGLRSRPSPRLKSSCAASS
jgi:C4-dicarboxylate-specific signal transduction histidine kinase